MAHQHGLHRVVSGRYAEVPFLAVLSIAYFGVSRTRRPPADSDLIALERADHDQVGGATGP